jgi:DNA polymerase-3 subunit alpha
MHEYFSDISSYDGALLPGVILPTVKIDDDQYEKLNLDKSVSNLVFLRKLCETSLVNKGLNRKEYIDRLNMELDVLSELGFIDYVILNWDIINFCVSNNIPTGFGRGSAPGSLVFYLSGITRIDPIKHGLFFERFVNKARAKKLIKDGVEYLVGSGPPDCDNDISYSRRGEVVSYIERKHKGKTCKILTLNTLSSKLCIKEVGKMIGGMSEPETNFVSSFIPKHFGKVASLEDSIKESDQFRNWANLNPVLINVAKKIHGLNKNTGVHPSGIVIAHDLIENIFPVTRTKDGDLVSLYDMNWVAQFSVKTDILGLKTLTVVNNACEALGISLDEINIDDQFIYDNLQDLRACHGLFQIEAHTNFQVCKKIKPRNLSELSDVIGAARPGALAYVDQYVNKDERSMADLKKLNGVLYKILEKTRGIPLYQEQTMAMSAKIFGFSLEEADELRRITAKKKPEELAVWEPRVYANAKRLNLSKELTDFYWQLLNSSANYSFNFSHAASYATLSATTIYLKFKYPQQFFLSLLKATKDEPDSHEEISKISKELQFFGMKLLSPDLGRSQLDFAIEGSDIRFGLNSIKGVAAGALPALTTFREKTHPTKFDVFTGAKQAGINVGILCSLIRAGCLSSYSEKRSRLTLEAQMWNILTDGEKRFAESVGAKYNYDILEIVSQCAIQNKAINEKGKPFMTEKRLATFKEKYSKFKEMYELNRKHEKFSNWFFEKKILGYSPSSRLKTIFNQDESNFTDTIEFQSASENDILKMVGTVGEVFSGKSKKNNQKYVRMSLKDEVGEINTLFMDSEKKMKLTDYLEEGFKIPVEGDIVCLTGRKSKSGDMLWLDSISVMDEKVFMNVSELKD